MWDAFTIGKRVRPTDLWQLGAFLTGATLLTYWLARRFHQGKTPPEQEATLPARVRLLLWQAPYLLIQFFFGSIFSALFILYFKSSGHFGTFIMTAILGGLLVANEFIGKRYGEHFTLLWTLLTLNAILLLNFALPHAIGSVNPLWFYLSTATGLLITHVVKKSSPSHPGHITPSWFIAIGLLLAWQLDMIAPVPIVKEEMGVGHNFIRDKDQYILEIEPAPFWAFWRTQSSTAHIKEGEKLYGVSATFAPMGITAKLEHRWEHKESSGWKTVYTSRFETSGGRERGFRGYSWVLNPQDGEWRFIVATQDGHTIATMDFTVEHMPTLSTSLVTKAF